MVYYTSYSIVSHAAVTKRVIGKNLFSLRSFWSNCRSYVFVWSSFTATDLINYNIIGIPQRVINIFFFATKYDLFGLLEKPRLMVIFHWLVYLFVSSTSLQSCIVLLGSQTAENKEKSYAIKDTLSGLRQLLVIERPLKMMKYAFYFMLKALPDLVVMWKNSLLRKQWLIFDVTDCITKITMHILSNISRSKLGQLISNEIWSVNKI